MRIVKHASSLVLVVALAACGGLEAGPDGSVTTPDAPVATVDVRVPDSHPDTPDARAPDGDLPDAHFPDARPDAPIPDAAIPDAPIPDARPDASPPDAAVPDAAIDAMMTRTCNGSVASQVNPGSTPPSAPAVTVTSGFTISTLATIPGGARELAALPNGDLLVGTSGTSVYIVANAEGSGNAGAAMQFAKITDSPVQGITFDQASCTIFIGSQHGIYAIPYSDGQLSGTPTKIASVRAGMVAPNTDGDVHITTSVALAGGTLYAGVGSGCNACTEVDPTRATIQQMSPSGANMTTKGARMRNAIALATNPATQTLWAGGAGQDNLPLGHPYEYFDAVTSHAGVADYGWPDCEENQHAYVAGSDCSQTVIPRIEFPAYSTLIGAVFYPANPTGPYAFPQQYRGSLFIAGHGSWHTTNGSYYSPPRVAFVPMNGDQPVTPVDWSDPSKQWSEFIGGWQLADGTTRIGRPTGITVGPKGTLFVADDQNSWVYRVRPQ
jgi:glucose/arabinose dehydrogenase